MLNIAAVLRQHESLHMRLAQAMEEGAEGSARRKDLLGRRPAETDVLGLARLDRVPWLIDAAGVQRGP